MKIGQTIDLGGRYTQRFLDENNLKLIPEAVGSKAEMLIWEHLQLGEFIFQNRALPEMNKILR